MLRVKKRTPTGKVFIHLKKRKPRIAKCAICKKPLHAVPRKTPSETRKLPKTKRRPERAYGGYLCSNCLKELLREGIRKRFG